MTSGFNIDTAFAQSSANRLITHQEELNTLLRNIEQEREELSAVFIGQTSNAYSVANQQWQQGQNTMNAALHELATLLQRNAQHYDTSDLDGASFFRAV
jgi:WXG100 family type VII secretion target